MLSKKFVSLLKERSFYAEFRRTLKRRQDQYITRHRKEIEDLRKRKWDGIEKDSRHRRVLNLCIYPFYALDSPPVELGYRFLRASPLSELGVRNMDFLVYNYTKKRAVAIFGEAKGSIASPTKIVRDTMEKKDIVVQNEDYIKSTYLKVKEKTVNFEYVIGVPVEKNIRICEAIEDAGGGLIPWSAGGLERRSLSLEIPKNVDKSIRKTMIHRDTGLNSSLKELKSHDSCFSVFPDSHDVTWLELMIEASDNLVIETSELEKRLQMYLFYLGDSEKSHFLKKMVGKAVEVGIVRKVGENTYRIKSKWKKKRDIAKDVREKWVEHSVNSELSENLDRIEEEAVEEFHQRIEKQKSLKDFKKQ